MKKIFKRENFIKNILVGLIIIVSIVLFEQIFKLVAFSLAQDTGKYLIFGEAVKLIEQKDYGFLFFNSTPLVVTIGLVILFIFFLVLGLLSDFHKAALFSSGTFLISGSALALLIDRVLSGYNLNYISVFSIPAFSVAHVFLVIGALMFVLDLILGKTPSKEEETE